MRKMLACIFSYSQNVTQFLFFFLHAFFFSFLSSLDANISDKFGKFSSSSFNNAQQVINYIIIIVKRYLCPFNLVNIIITLSTEHMVYLSVNLSYLSFIISEKYDKFKYIVNSSNSLLKEKFLDYKSFADDKSNIAKIMNSVFDQAKIVVEE